MNDNVFIQGMPCHKYIFPKLKNHADALSYERILVDTLTVFGCKDKDILAALALQDANICTNSALSNFSFLEYEGTMLGEDLLTSIRFDTSVAVYKRCNQFYNKFDARITACKICPLSKKYVNANYTSEMRLLRYIYESAEHYDYFRQKGLLGEHFTYLYDLMDQGHSEKPCLFGFTSHLYMALEDECIRGEYYANNNHILTDSIKSYLVKGIKKAKPPKAYMDAAWSIDITGFFQEILFAVPLCTAEDADRAFFLLQKQRTVKDRTSINKESNLDKESFSGASAQNKKAEGVVSVERSKKDTPKNTVSGRAAKKSQPKVTISPYSLEDLFLQEASTESLRKDDVADRHSPKEIEHALREPDIDKTVTEVKATAQESGASQGECGSDTVDGVASSVSDEDLLLAEDTLVMGGDSAALDTQNDTISVPLEDAMGAVDAVEDTSAFVNEGVYSADKEPSDNVSECLDSSKCEEVESEKHSANTELDEYCKESGESGIFIQELPFVDSSYLAIPYIHAEELSHFAVNLDTAAARILTIFENHVLKSKMLCIEIVEVKDSYAFLMWVPKLHSFVTCGLKSCDVLAPLLSHSSIQKICFHPYMLYALLARHGLTVKNVHSIFSTYSLNHIGAKGDTMEDVFGFYHARASESGITFKPVGDYDNIYIRYMPAYVYIYRRQLRELAECALEDRLSLQRAYDECLGMSYLLDRYLADSRCLFSVPYAGRYEFLPDIRNESYEQGYFLTYRIVYSKKSAERIFCCILSRLVQTGRFRTYPLMLVSLKESEMTLFVLYDYMEYITTIINVLFLEHIENYNEKGLELLEQHIESTVVNRSEDVEKQKDILCDLLDISVHASEPEIDEGTFSTSEEEIPFPDTDDKGEYYEESEYSSEQSVEDFKECVSDDSSVNEGRQQANGFFEQQEEYASEDYEVDELALYEDMLAAYENVGAEDMSAAASADNMQVDNGGSDISEDEPLMSVTYSNAPCKEVSVASDDKADYLSNPPLTQDYTETGDGNESSVSSGILSQLNARFGL